MPASLSKNALCSFVGDVLPLYLTDGDADLTDADITWTVSGAAAALRSFADDPHSPFRHGVLITLREIGTSTVTAIYKGQCYLCSVTARARRTASPDSTLHLYRGDLHIHTASTHTPDKFAAQAHVQAACIAALDADKRLDFGILSDHASVMRRRGFFDSFIELENAAPTNTVILPGSESEVTVLENDRFDLPHKHSGEIVVLGADNCASTKSWGEFYDAMAQSQAPVGIFAHPFVLGAGQSSLWSYPFPQMRTPSLYRLMRGIELGSGSQEGGALLYEYAYSAALDNGFHVSPTCGSDCHGPAWGFAAMRGKTVIAATEKSREALLDALLHNRFYATESGNIKLRYAVNGHAAPATLPAATQYDFCVEIGLFEENDTTRPTVCEVISDRGRTVHTCPVTGNTITFTVRSDTARYFYLRLIDLGQARRITAVGYWARRFTKDWIKEVSVDWKAEIGARVLDIIKRYVTRYAIFTSVDGKRFLPAAEGEIRAFGDEEILRFSARNARFVRFDALSTVGAQSGIPSLATAPVAIGELSVFEDA